MYLPRHCANQCCNRQFLPSGPTQKYCTTACGEDWKRRTRTTTEYFRNQARDNRTRRTRERLTCKRCGVTFTGKRTDSPLCQTCKEERPTIFVGVDGEGVQGRCTHCDCATFRPDNRGSRCVCQHPKYDHEHTYVLIGCGAEHISDPKGLHYTDVFRFLYAQYERQPWAAFVGYFLGYDFTQWLKTIPGDKAWLLLTEEGRKRRARRTKDSNGEKVEFSGQWPVRLNEDKIGTDQAWEIDILAAKRLKLRPMICDCDLRPDVKCSHTKPGWMSICDVGPFFQSSFLSVIEPTPKKWPHGPICTDQEYALIEAGKNLRSDAVLDGDMVRYNALENELLSRLMPRLDEGFRSLGIRLRKDEWYGPGAAARTWLRNQGAPKRVDLEKDGLLPYWVRQAALGAYFGGWFEIMAHGHIPGVTHEYDINSAYPAQIVNLPCLLHGEWRQDRRPVGARLKPGEIRLVHAGAGGVVGSDPFIGAMMHRRKDDFILRPRMTGGWFWVHEIEAAMRAGLVDSVDVDDGWTYRPCNCPPPFAVVGDLYRKRLEVVKESPTGKAIKLLINSLYGVFAQTVGGRTYANYVYAGLITSGTRAMILDAIAGHPDQSAAVSMVATDAVYFTSPHPTLVLSDQLGDWETKEKTNLTIFKPGTYWDDVTREDVREGRKPIFKARGINAKAFAGKLREIDESFHQLDTAAIKWPSVRYTSDFSMVTAKSAVHRGKWRLAGNVDVGRFDQSSDPELKRCDPYVDTSGVLRSRPWEHADSLSSKSYPDPTVTKDHREMLGIEEVESFVEDYESADGPIGAILYGMIGSGQWAD